MEGGMDGLSVQENKGSPEQAFIDELLEKGLIEIQTPENLGERKFCLSYRSAKNPRISTETIDNLTFHKMSKFLSGYSTTHAIDLFEIITINGKEVHVPVGHRDYDIARLSNGRTIASGNHARHRNELTHTGPIPVNDFFNPYEFADSNLGTASNGIDVLGEVNPTNYGYEIGIRQRFGELGLLPNSSWRGNKFGNLLGGVGIEILRKQGVNQVEFGDVSSKVEPILSKIGYTPGTSSLAMSTISPQTTHQMFSPFIPQRLRQ